MIDVADLLKCPWYPSPHQGYNTYPATPATGILYITDHNPEFLSGHVRMRGEKNGSYPHFYTEMIDNLFGKDKNTIEVCSYLIPHTKNLFTVDENPNYNPKLRADGQKLDEIADNRFTRWRCDPPYNAFTAKKMYGTGVPSPIQLLKAGARVIKPGSLMFLLLGAQNYQWHAAGTKRIGLILITIVPNNEIRALNIYLKL